MKYAKLMALACGMLLCCVGCSKTGGVDLGSVGGVFGGKLGEQIGHGVEAGGQFAHAAALNEKDDDRYGQAFALVLTNHYPVCTNDKLQKYVALVGLTVASVSPKPGGNYVFGVLETDVVNAWSGPGGYIFITTGALKLMRNEAELAGVLGHEIGHVCDRHGMANVQKAEEQGALVNAAKIADEGQRWSAVLDQASDVLLNSYSQSQEYEADAAGLKMASDAGYDPHAYIQFLGRIEAQQKGGHPIMSTHPGIDNRIAKLDEQVRSLPPGGATLSERFAAAMQ